MKNCDALLLVPYFRGLKEEIICSILEYAFVKNVPRGAYLFTADETCRHLFIIKEGLIEISLIGEDGRKIILHHAGKSAFLGDTIFFDEGKYGAVAYAVRDTEILAIEKKSLEKLIYDYPEIGMRMLIDFGRRIQMLKAFAAEIVLNDVRKRSIRLLLTLAKGELVGGQNTVTLINIPTQEEMASRIGTVREVLCRELHKLEKENLIKVKRGQLTVCNVKKLKGLVLGEDGDGLFPITLPMQKFDVSSEVL